MEGTEVATPAKVKTTMTAELSRNGKHVVFTQSKFVNGLELSTKRGIKAIDPAYDADEIVLMCQEQVGKGQWKLTGEKDSSGFYTPEFIGE